MVRLSKERREETALNETSNLLGEKNERNKYEEGRNRGTDGHNREHDGISSKNKPEVTKENICIFHIFVLYFIYLCFI